MLRFQDEFGVLRVHRVNLLFIRSVACLVGLVPIIFNVRDINLVAFLVVIVLDGRPDCVLSLEVCEDGVVVCTRGARLRRTRSLPSKLR